MRFLGAVAVFIFVTTASFIQAASVSAGTITVSGKITITASVAHTHYVIVDAKNNITEITSNTTQLVTPRIFRASITDANELPLNNAVYEQYRQLTLSKNGTIGTLYKKPATLTKPDKQTSLLPLRLNTLSITNFLR